MIALLPFPRVEILLTAVGDRPAGLCCWAARGFHAQIHKPHVLLTLGGATKPSLELDRAATTPIGALPGRLAGWRWGQKGGEG